MLSSVLFIVALFSFLLGSLALVKGNKGSRTRSFVIFTGLVGSWLFFYALTYLLAPRYTDFLTRCIVVPAIFFPLVMLYFFRTFQDRERLLNTWEQLVFGLVGGGVLLMVPTSWHMSNIHFENGAILFRPGPAYNVQGLLLLLGVVLAFSTLWQARKQALKQERAQINILFVGIGISAISGLVFNFLLPVMGLTQYNGLGPISIIALIVAAYLVILRHHFLNIPHLLQRSALYALLYVSLVSLLCFGVLGINQYLQSVWHIPSTPVLLALAFLMVALYEPLKSLFAAVSGSLFLVDGGDWSQHLARWTAATTAAPDQSELLQQVAEVLQWDYGLQSICIYVRRTEGQGFQRAYDASPWQLEAEVDEKITWFSLLQEHKSMLVADVDQAAGGLTQRPFYNFWASKGVEVVLPLVFKDQWEGILLLGEKKSQQNYTWENKTHLETMGLQLAAALAHWRTRLHMHTQERLAALGVMSAGIAHEIRNPMVSIKAFSQLLPTKYDDPTYRQKFEQIVLPQLNRIEDLVTALLHAGKPRRPSRMLVDANEVIRDVILLCDPERKNHHCEIQFDAGKPVVIYADRSQMTQVFLNLTRNALQAMRQSGMLRVQAHYANDDWAEIEFKDTGEGMTADELEHLFDPFYTTKQEGTGLGLSISYRIIEEHGGKIILDSVPKLGTSFKLRLPRTPVAAGQSSHKVYIRPGMQAS